MCGIVGVTGIDPALPFIIEALSRLEYRGYDSAGVALHADGEVWRRRRSGKLAELAGAVDDAPRGCTTGIGHTRWATHGPPVERNAHPHADCGGRLAITHNGIIENYVELSQELAGRGHEMTSDTDTEVLAHLLEESLATGLSLVDSVRAGLARVQGSFALAVIHADDPDLIVAARRGSPLIAGLTEGSGFVASDIPAILPLTREIYVIDDDQLRAIDKVFIVGCGTSFYSGLVAKYAIEHWARLPVEIDVASEFRYRDPVLDANSLVIGVSQSGESLDTMEACRFAGSAVNKAVVLAVCNVVDSSMARDADAVLYTRAGPEVGVAATKTHVAQIVAMELLALHLGVLRGTLYPDEMSRLVEALHQVPDRIAAVLDRSAEICEIGHRFADTRDFFFLGRGVGYPVALEGALKLKEISYARAEGYPAGEMKHGPIALIEPGTVVVAVATRGRLHAKIMANIEEMRARGATVIAVATVGDTATAARADEVLWVPPTPPGAELLAPAVDVVALQLFAYALAKARGRDVDKPRNLAKTVTVE